MDIDASSHSGLEFQELEDRVAPGLLGNIAAAGLFAAGLGGSSKSDSSGSSSSSSSSSSKSKSKSKSKSSKSK